VITIAPADDLTIVRELITEYASSLGVDLSFQDLDHELATLETFYELVLLARDDDRVAGCVALRRIDEEICEMKRLYVRPAFRGINLGRKLAQSIIDAARERGYKRMRLDTLPTTSGNPAVSIARIRGDRAVPVQSCRRDSLFGVDPLIELFFFPIGSFGGVAGA
jgi:N-acetylglutamate synthase-like GNAT family acetyltransferase